MLNSLSSSIRKLFLRFCVFSLVRKNLIRIKNRCTHIFAMSRHNPISETGSGSTNVNINQFCYTWKIRNFEYWVPTKRDSGYVALESPKFSTNYDENELLWNLNLHPSPSLGTSPNMSTNDISLKSHITDWVMCSSLHLELYFLNADGEEVAGKRLKFSENLRDLITSEEYWFRGFVERDFILDKKNKLLEQGALTILCKIVFVKGVSNHPGLIDQPVQPIVEVQQCLEPVNELERLLFSIKYSDFTLVADGKEIPVHRSILAIKSRVFAAMFDSDIREGRVEIVDVELNIIRELLRFVYVGKVYNIEEYAAQLLAAAETYELEELKALCEEGLIENMSVENIDEVLVVLDKYNTSKLNTAVIAFIARNAELLARTEKFVKVMKGLSWSLMSRILGAFMRY